MIALNMLCQVFVFLCIAQQWAVFSDGYKMDDRISTVLERSKGKPTNYSHNARVIRPCVMKDPCSCARSDGTGINLHFLDSGPKPRFTARGNYNIIKWNPCTGFKVGSTKDVSVASGFSSGQLFPFGLQSTAKFNMENNKPVIDYAFRGSTSRIILLCDDRAKPTFAFVSEKTPLVGAYNGPCNPKDEPKSISLGSIILITFFVILVVYIVVGTLLNVYVKKADGRERFPNYSFWAGLPSLIKDGCTFTFCHLRRRRSEYGEI